MAKTLIFGGAFDPPHNEHIAICKSAMAALGADKLVVVPTYMPPHKDGGFLKFEDRCELIKAAFKDFDVVVDQIEKERGGDNYSYIILPLMKEKYGDIAYLIGGDSLQYFESWRNPEQIAKVCPIAVAERDGFDDVRETAHRLAQKFGAEFILTDYVGEDVSSSMLKARLLLGEEVGEIPLSVTRIIRERGWFCEYESAVEKLKGFQSEELFYHSKAVVKRAVDFNSKHNLKLEFRKVFLSALLHDNAKQRPSLDGLPVPPDCIGTPVLHQFLGAEKARRDFGVDDKDVLDAIRYHTTAKADMSLLEKLIYTADSLSDDREYQPIPKLRKIAGENFENGFLETLKYTVDKLIAKGGKIYPLTLSAYKYYIDNEDGVRTSE